MASGYKELKQVIYKNCSASVFSKGRLRKLNYVTNGSPILKWKLGAAMPNAFQRRIVYVLVSILYSALSFNAFSQQAISRSQILGGVNTEALSSEISNKIKTDPQLRKSIGQRMLGEEPVTDREPGRLIVDLSHRESSPPKVRGGDPTRHEVMPDTMDGLVYSSLSTIGEDACLDKDNRCRQSVRRIIANQSAGTNAVPSSPAVRDNCQKTFDDYRDSKSFLFYLSSVGTIYDRANPIFIGDGSLKSEAKKLLIEYIKKCYKVGLSSKEASFIGILVDDSSNELVGMATLLDESTAITAAHVLFRLDEKDQPTARRNTQNLRLIVANNTSHPLKIEQASISPGWDASDSAIQNLDQAILTLSEKVNVVGQYPQKTALPVDKKVRLRIPGISLPFYQADISLGNAPPDPTWKSWATYAVADPKDACKVYLQMDNGCVTHGCSVFKGMSGAGVFVYDDADSTLPPQLVAIHSGSLVSASNCSTPNINLPRINVASRVIP